MCHCVTVEIRYWKPEVRQLQIIFHVPSTNKKFNFTVACTSEGKKFLSKFSLKTEKMYPSSSVSCDSLRCCKRKFVVGSFQ